MWSERINRELNKQNEIDSQQAELNNNNNAAVTRNPFEIDLTSNISNVEQKNDLSSTVESTMQMLAGHGIGFACVFGEIVLAHPLIVLRRQCQIRAHALSGHTTPFTLLPVIVRLVRSYGAATLWKGLSSVLCVRALHIINEGLLSELLDLPKEISRHSSARKILQHLNLKIISLAFLTPFYCSSLIETVQSDIASEAPTLISCFREGFARLFSAQNFRLFTLPAAFSSISAASSSSSSSPSLAYGGTFSIWKVALPFVLYHTAHYCVRELVNISVKKHHRGEEADLKPPDPRHASRSLDALFEQFHSDLAGRWIGLLCADALLFPLETLMNRCCIQGTRTIIDNLDLGGVASSSAAAAATATAGVASSSSVVPATLNYSGLSQLFSDLTGAAVLPTLYKGFGALLLQIGLMGGIFLGAKFTFEQLMIWSDDKKEEAGRREREMMRGDRLRHEDVATQRRIGGWNDDGSRVDDFVASRRAPFGAPPPAPTSSLSSSVYSSAMPTNQRQHSSAFPADQ